MKKLFTSLTVFLFAAFSQFAQAQVSAPINYYVTNGEQFTLTPQGDQSLSKLFWRVDGALTEILGTVSGGALTTSFSDATSEIKTHTIKLSVIADLLAGCQSDEIEYNIIVLPKLTLSITTPTKTNFCAGVDVDVELQATLSANISNLAEYGIELPYIWKDQNNNILTSVTDKLKVTEAGTYSVLCEYKLPIAGALLPTATKLVSNIITGASQQIKHDLPLPTIPVITLN